MLKLSQISKIKESLKTQNISLVDVFSLLGDKNRFLIIKLLIEQGEMCVTDLANVLDISVSAVSQHLRILEMSRMVEGEKMGQMMCYKPKIDDPKIKDIINLM
ncbi:transcriptional regulator [Candidatus Campbellbacteria bacterium CG22_combo_CG10-13_8_21_14_all_43_18]|uniref:Transcriptional regulator n=1 Tax=Candidatus Campbellbacteria bacterium CG22_combo_CG10-13_8_21_14_all_43_18 TaxID=1974530 RepID=A0A2H0DVR7_9BACT|nr:MAG: transcriptional regulator [Candidatus Campbellbacteria bacterium CG22_combo_CG10-13_8_21_14_all_43_18]